MKKFDTGIQILFLTVSIGAFIFFVFISPYAMPDKRIVVRSDELYEVELRFGMSWYEMGGPYKTIEEARNRIKYWEDFQKEQMNK
jgi:hypothetical protein